MQIPCLGMTTFPYQWSDDELPHDTDCGVSVAADFASMSTLQKNAWVPSVWKEEVRKNWENIEHYLRGRLSPGFGGRRPKKPLEHGEAFDRDAIRRRLDDPDLAVMVNYSNQKIRRLVGQVSDRRKKPNVEKVTPDEWNELREKLVIFHLSPKHWSGEMEEDKYRELLEFLTEGRVPDEVNMAEEHKPQLNAKQAAGVIWFLNVVTGLCVNDIRFSACARCGHFAATCNHAGSFICEGCGVHVCEDCGNEICGEPDLESEPWWPEGAMPEDFCHKCIDLARSELTTDC